MTKDDNSPRVGDGGELGLLSVLMAVSEGIKLPNRGDPLLVDVDHVARHLWVT